MILKEHPITYTAIQVRRSIDRLEAYEEMNPVEAEKHMTNVIIEALKNVYNMFPRELRK